MLMGGDGSGWVEQDGVGSCSGEVERLRAGDEDWSKRESSMSTKSGVDNGGLGQEERRVDDGELGREKLRDWREGEESVIVRGDWGQLSLSLGKCAGNGIAELADAESLGVGVVS